MTKCNQASSCLGIKLDFCVFTPADAQKDDSALKGQGYYNTTPIYSANPVIILLYLEFFQ